MRASTPFRAAGLEAGMVELALPIVTAVMVSLLRQSRRTPHSWSRLSALQHKTNRAFREAEHVMAAPLTMHKRFIFLL
jgi:hypothetical protein